MHYAACVGSKACSASWLIELSSIGRTTMTTVGSLCNKGVTSYRISNSTMIDENQTMVFRDGVEQWEAGIKSGWEETRDVAMTDNPTYDEFFARPVVYNLPTWTPGQASPYTATFNPWTLFFQNKRVVNKLCNFNLAQTTLKVKFLINGNAFYYGRLMADYVPLQVYDNVDTLNTLNKNAIIQASQRLKLFLNPTTSQGGILSLPFFYPKNAAGLTVDDISALGQIYIREINGLKHANAGTDVVSIQAYIWADNMRLSVPTTVDASGIVPQAKDEYGTGPISSVASSIAKATGKLEAAPIIGPYMKATSMVATGVGSLAKAFGYSRVPIIEEPTNMRPRIISNLTNTNVPDAVTKLTVDAKQEVTIDPSVTGIDMPDELCIRELAMRESYITQYNWAVTAARGQLLWNTRVGPTMAVFDNTFTNLMTWAPACTFVALPFKWWRGTMRYRFQIVCSEYHKGRLRIVYDPNNILSTEGNVAMSRIIDLTTERDFVVDVSWGQPLPFALTALDTSFGTVLLPGGGPTANGVLGVYVENDLTSPNTTINNDIQVNVFVSMCDDAEFAVPTDNIDTYTYSTQAGEESSDAPAIDTDNAPVKTDNDDEIMSCLKVDHTYDVHFGESITSFRQLIKRYNYHSSVLLPVAVAGRYNWVIRDRDFPRYRGKWADAVDAPITGTTNINNARNTLINYLAPAFVAYRGGLRWKYLYHTDNMNDVDYQRVYRVTDESGTAINAASSIVFTPANFSQTRAQQLASMQTGGEVTYTRAQPSLEIEVPYYTPYRFSLTKNIGTHTSAVPSEITLSHALHTDATITANAYYDRFVAGAEDFSLFLFNGAPPFRSIDLVT